MWHHCYSFQRTEFPALDYTLCKPTEVSLRDYYKEQIGDRLRESVRLEKTSRIISFRIDQVVDSLVLLITALALTLFGWLV